jgi:hypothetical protein
VGNLLPTDGLYFTVDPALVNNPFPANAGLSIDDAVGNKVTHPTDFHVLYCEVPVLCKLG